MLCDSKPLPRNHRCWLAIVPVYQATGVGLDFGWRERACIHGRVGDAAHGGPAADKAIADTEKLTRGNCDRVVHNQAVLGSHGIKLHAYAINVELRALSFVIRGGILNKRQHLAPEGCEV